MNKGDYFKKWIELDEKVSQNPNDESITIFVKGDCYNNIFITNDKKNHRMFMIEFYPQSLNGYKPIMFTLSYSWSSTTTCWAETFSSSRLGGYSSRGNQQISAYIFYIKE